MIAIALLGASFSMALRRLLAFRVNLIFDVVMSMIWLAVTLATVLVVYTATDTLAGWSLPEALILIGTFQVLSGLKQTFLDPNLSWFPERGIRQGKLDVMLLQPAPTLFLVSLSSCSPLSLVQSGLGLGVIVVGLARLGRPPEPAAVVSWLVMIMVGLVITWSLGMILAVLAFWAPKLQLDVFYGSAWQLARYPVDIYPGPLRAVLTYLFPMALIATAPTLVLVRGPDPALLLGGIAGAIIGAGLTTLCWRLGLRRYTGATS
ncbi:ABC transporter permease [Microlunatus speluncae]|uniref:ABC transporter permease n=1 Tax=Microlunatus speluncae TaxID=2594267 RepID=UPI00126655BD|nr:ABC-2 family transporter protein [Microlunatus speluncae]